MNPADNYDERDFEDARDLVQFRQIHRRRPKHVRNLAARLVSELAGSDNEAYADLRQAWVQVAGDRFSSRSGVGLMKRGVLEIHVDRSITLQQMAFEKRRMLKEMQQKLPHWNIQDLRFRIGNTK